MRRAAKLDANHREVADGLRKAGYNVMDLAHAGNGIPDLAVSNPSFRGFSCLVEVKDGSKAPSGRKLTPDQVKVLEGWAGHWIVALSLEDALAKLKEIHG